MRQIPAGRSAPARKFFIPPYRRKACISYVVHASRRISENAGSTPVSGAAHNMSMPSRGAKYKRHHVEQQSLTVVAR